MLSRHLCAAWEVVYDGLSGVRDQEHVLLRRCFLFFESRSVNCTGLCLNDVMRVGHLWLAASVVAQGGLNSCNRCVLMEQNGCFYRVAFRVAEVCLIGELGFHLIIHEEGSVKVQRHLSFQRAHPLDLRQDTELY